MPLAAAMIYGAHPTAESRTAEPQARKPRSRHRLRNRALTALLDGVERSPVLASTTSLVDLAHNLRMLVSSPEEGWGGVYVALSPVVLEALGSASRSAIAVPMRQEGMELCRSIGRDVAWCVLPFEEVRAAIAAASSRRSTRTVRVRLRFEGGRGIEGTAPVITDARRFLVTAQSPLLAALRGRVDELPVPQGKAAHAYYQSLATATVLLEGGVPRVPRNNKGGLVDAVLQVTGLEGQDLASSLPSPGVSLADVDVVHWGTHGRLVELLEIEKRGDISCALKRAERVLSDVRPEWPAVRIVASESRRAEYARKLAGGMFSENLLARASFVSNEALLDRFTTALFGTH